MITCPSREATEDGDMREWQWPGLTQRYNHRHLSHIYPMFPGREIVKGVAPKELTDQFELAVDKRLLGAQTGWSLAHTACINARFERPQKALECLDTMCRASLTKSFFTLHNDWRNMGQTLYRDNGAFCSGTAGRVHGCSRSHAGDAALRAAGMCKAVAGLTGTLEPGKGQTAVYAGRSGDDLGQTGGYALRRIPSGPRGRG